MECVEVEGDHRGDDVADPAGKLGDGLIDDSDASRPARDETSAAPCSDTLTRRCQDLRAVDEADLELFDSDGEIERLDGRIDRVERLLSNDATATGQRALRLMTDPQTAASVREERHELFGDPPAEPERRAGWVERAGRISQLQRWTRSDERAHDHPAYAWHMSDLPTIIEPPARKREMPSPRLEPPAVAAAGVVRRQKVGEVSE